MFSQTYTPEAIRFTSWMRMDVLGVGTVFVLSGQCDGNGRTAGGYVCGNSANVSVTDNNQLNNGPFLYSMDGINYQNTGDFANIAREHRFYIKDKNGKVQIVGI